MRSNAMYDIFMKFPDGSPLWLEAVEGLDEARKRLARLLRTSSAEYFIYSEKSGGIVERASAGDHDEYQVLGPSPSSRRSGSGFVH
jgi:hypothetical protein